MTTTTDKTARCEKSPNCLHPICPCGNRIRTSAHRIKDHPGTVQGSTKSGKCQNCILRGTPTGKQKRIPRYVNQERLRHIESLPTEDDRIRYVSPGFWDYLERRRKQGVPAEGIKFKETTQ